jgi:hypothetical protein
VICADELGPVIPRTFPPPPSCSTGWSTDGHRIRRRWSMGVVGRRPGCMAPCDPATARRSPDRAVSQLGRLPAAAGRGRAGQPDRRHRGHHRQRIQPQQRLHPIVAGRAPPHPPGVHPGRRVLAEPPGGLVATVPPRRPGRAGLRQPQGDRARHRGSDRPAQRACPSMGMGPPTALATLPTTRPHLPHLRNLALSRWPEVLSVTPAATAAR